MLDKLRKQAKILMAVDNEKYSIILDILARDNCFFEISMEEALSILRDLKVKEEDIIKVYLDLVSKENYSD
ncbi:MAG: hypothetical protein OSJ65_07245 [Bacilli bacterium]|nr:hypothetical protein [Bacilli bacterium]